MPKTKANLRTIHKAFCLLNAESPYKKYGLQSISKIIFSKAPAAWKANTLSAQGNALGFQFGSHYSAPTGQKPYNQMLMPFR